MMPAMRRRARGFKLSICPERAGRVGLPARFRAKRALGLDLRVETGSHGNQICADRV